MPEGRRLHRVQVAPDAGDEAPRQPWLQGIRRGGGLRGRGGDGERAELVQGLVGVPGRRNVPHCVLRGQDDVAVPGDQDSSRCQPGTDFVRLSRAVNRTKKRPGIQEVSALAAELRSSLVDTAKEAE